MINEQEIYVIIALILIVYLLYITKRSTYCFRGGWDDVGCCTEEGKQKQIRMLSGDCDESEAEERTIDCCYQTGWTNNGSCSSEGKQLQTRETFGNCDNLSTERMLDCCYHTAWEGRDCINNTVTQTREANGVCLGEDAYTTRTATCNYDLSSGTKCGSGYGQCRGGCCSSVGWCGGGSAYCNYSQSQYNAPEDWVYS